MAAHPMKSGAGRRFARLLTAALAAGVLAGLPAHAGPPAGLVMAPAQRAAWEDYELPVPGGIVRHFDPPAQAWLAGHRGVDLRAGVGESVRSTGPGVVAFAGTVVDRPLVSIDHPIGVRTTYEAVTPAVTAGQTVAAGEVIGTVAAGNGHCEPPCLHWGARVGEDTYIDPMRLLRAPVIRLFPTRGGEPG